MRELGLKLCPRYTFSVSAQHDIHPNGRKYNPRGPRFFLRSFLVQVGHAGGKEESYLRQTALLLGEEELTGRSKAEVRGLITLFLVLHCRFRLSEQWRGGRGVETCAVGV